MNRKPLTTHKTVKQEIQTLSIETSLQDAESRQCFTQVKDTMNKSSL